MSKENASGGYREYEDAVEPPLYQNLQPGSKSEGPLDHLKDGLQGQARMAFITKVYALLSLELLITFSFCLIAQFSEGYRQFQLNNGWVIIIPIILMIAVMIVAFCAQKARVFPFDMVLLLVFILSFSYIISFCCSAVVDSTQDSAAVPLAIGATMGVTAALTLYAFLCKGHYMVWLGILVICCATAFVIGITSIFVRIPILLVVICALGVIIYGIYLVIITKMIIGDELGGFPLDSAIIASVFLYIYIMRLFLYLLTIIAALRK